MIDLTSVCRDKGKKSVHPYGLAFDAVVLWSRCNMDSECLNALGVRLGNEYDILLHDAGSGEHFHIEYDPR